MRQFFVLSVLAFGGCMHDGLPGGASHAGGDLGGATATSSDLGTDGQVPTASVDLALPSPPSCTMPALAAVYGACDVSSATLCFVPDPTTPVPTLDQCHCEPDHKWWCSPMICQQFGEAGCPNAPPQANVACTRDYACHFCCSTATVQCTCATEHLPSCKIVASCGG